MSERFHKSAVGAYAILSTLFENAEFDSGKLAAPQLLELLTLCRETNLRLPMLEAYSKACDEAPVLTLLGGDAETAMDVARSMKLEAELLEAPDAPIMWWIEPAAKSRSLIQVGMAERELSRTALTALLGAPLPPDRLTVVKCEVKSKSQWRFAWLPDADALALQAASPGVLEALIGAHMLVVVGDDVPAPFQPWLSRPGMILRQFAATEIVRDDVRPKLLSELSAMQDHSYDEQLAVHAATWQFLLPLFVSQLDALRQQYTLDIDRQNMKLQTTRQTLGEYRSNWTNGMRNILDDYYSKKATGNAMAALLDPRQPGPQTGTYLQALALPSLWKRLDELLNERLGEFVQGLGALANRVDLRTISLKEMDMRWNPASLAQQIEEELIAKRIFPEGGGERSGLVGSLMGKKDDIISTRKAQILRANKSAQSVIEQGFLQWCDQLMHAVEQRVRVQIAAAQVNQGLPDIENLRMGLTGIDRLTAMLEGNREGTRQEPVKRVAQLLRGWRDRKSVV